MDLRKISFTKETILADAGKPTAEPITRAVAVAVLAIRSPAVSSISRRSLLRAPSSARW